MSPEMLQTASNVMANMLPEGMQSMMSMAAGSSAAQPKSQPASDLQGTHRHSEGVPQRCSAGRECLYALCLGFVLVLSPDVRWVFGWPLKTACGLSFTGSWVKSLQSSHRPQ
ncbi:TPA: hypothetical protein ACH3X2_007308 [Trebouxia sp. C0005]